MAKRFANFLDQALFYGLIFILLIPLLSLRTPIFGFLFRQELVFQMAVEIIFLVWLLRYALNKSVGTGVNLRSPVFLGVLAFVVAFGLSTFFAFNRYRAFFSNWDRLSGYFLLLHIFAFFLILVTFAKDKKIWRTLLTVSVVTSGLTGLYALGQRAGLIAVPGATFVDQRIIGTLGNAAFFAAYLLFNIFLALYLGFEEKSRRYLFLGAAGFDALALFLTGTRGAYLGVYSGLLIAALLLIFQPHKSIEIRINRRFKKIAGISVILLLLAPIIVFSLAKAFPQNLLLSRLSLSALNIGVRNRLLVWATSWDAFKERPVLGWGIDNFAYGFDKHFNPKILENVLTQESWFDRAHNIFFDTLVAGGIAGTLGYVLFLGILFFSALKFTGKDPAGAVLVGLLAAYVIQGMFLFDVFQTYLMLFFVAGFLNFINQKPAPVAEAREIKINRLVFLPALVLLLPVTGFSFYSYNLKSAWATGLAWKGATYFAKDQKAFESFWRQSFDMKNPYTPDRWLEFSNFILENSPAKKIVNISPNDLRSSLGLALDSFGDIKNHFNLGAQYYYQAGRIGNFLWSVGGQASPKDIEENLQTALKLSPRRTDIYYDFADFERLKGDTSKMLEYLKQALALDDKIPQTHFNLALAYGMTGRLNDAIGEADKAEALGYVGWKTRYNELVFLIDIYLKAGRHDEKLVELFKTAIGLNPTDPQLYGSLAVLEKELGHYDAAAFYARKVMELDASKKAEVEEFLRSINP